MLLRLRFKLLLLIALNYCENIHVSGYYVFPHGYDNPYDPYQDVITPAPPPDLNTSTIAPGAVTTTEIPMNTTPTPPTATTTTEIASTPLTPSVTMTTTLPPDSTTPCAIPPSSHIDGLLHKYYQQFNYHRPHGDMVPQENSSGGVHLSGELRPRPNTPLRHPGMPITYETTYMTGPNVQGTLTRLVSNDNSVQGYSSSVVQSHSSATAGGLPTNVGWQGVGASTLRGFNPYNELLHMGRRWHNYPARPLPFAI